MQANYSLIQRKGDRRGDRSPGALVSLSGCLEDREGGPAASPRNDWREVTRRGGRRHPSVGFGGEHRQILPMPSQSDCRVKTGKSAIDRRCGVFDQGSANGVVFRLEKTIVATSDQADPASKSASAQGGTIVGLAAVRDRTWVSGKGCRFEDCCLDGPQADMADRHRKIVSSCVPRPRHVERLWL